MTDRDTPEPRPASPGLGNTRLEAVERLRRQLDAIEARTRKADKPSHLARYGSGVYSAETYGRHPDEDEAEDGYPEESTPHRTPARRQSAAPDAGHDAEPAAEQPYSATARRRRAPSGTFETPEGSHRRGKRYRRADIGAEPDSAALEEERGGVEGERGGSDFAGPGSEPEESERGRGRGRGARRRSDGGGEPGEGLPGGGTEAQAKEVCLRLLTDRARSRAELADRLAAKGFSAEVAGRALDRLAEVGLIDDAAFAEQWVHSRHTFSGKGKKALAQELRRKGVAPEDAESALAGISAEDEHERATELVRRKLRTVPRDLDREKTIRRLVGMLARRGYNQSTAFTVVKAELADRDLAETDSH